jgi:hypothetical protein
MGFISMLRDDGRGLKDSAVQPPPGAAFGRFLVLPHRREPFGCGPSLARP